MPEKPLPTITTSYLFFSLLIDVYLHIIFNFGHTGTDIGFTVYSDNTFEAHAHAAESSAGFVSEWALFQAFISRGDKCGQQGFAFIGMDFFAIDREGYFIFSFDNSLKVFGIPLMPQV